MKFLNEQNPWQMLVLPILNGDPGSSGLSWVGPCTEVRMVHCHKMETKHETAKMMIQTIAER